MATITDVLVTSLEFRGVRPVTTALLDLASLFGTLAAAEGVATAAAGTLSAALSLLDSPLLLIGAAIGVITAGVGFLAKSIAAFSDSEDAIGRIAIQMKNLGNVFPIDELTEFASGLSRLTGIDDELIASLGVAAAQFGLTRQQIEKALPTVLDLAVANKKDPQEVLHTLFRASRGRPQGLTALNINPDLIKGDLKDINNLINQVGQSFAGTAEAFRHTLPGTVKALNTAVDNFFEAVGRFISPVWVRVLDALTINLQTITVLLDRLADFLHLPTAAALGEGKANPLALKGDPEQTGYLKDIAKNTERLAPFIDHVLGGTGEVAGRGFTWRDAKAAWGV